MSDRSCEVCGKAATTLKMALPVGPPPIRAYCDRHSSGAPASDPVAAAEAAVRAFDDYEADLNEADFDDALEHAATLANHVRALLDALKAGGLRLRAVNDVLWEYEPRHHYDCTASRYGVMAGCSCGRDDALARIKGAS